MNEIDFTQLQPVLVWLVSGVGAGIVAYALWGQLERWFPAVDNLNKELKRHLTILLAVVISVAAFGIQLAMGYEPIPPTPVAWVERIFSIVALTIITALTIHGRRQLRIAI